MLNLEFCHQVSSGNVRVIWYSLLRSSQSFTTVNIQRKVLLGAFLKIICPGLLFFPKPLEELVFHKNALRNRGKNGTCSQIYGYCSPRSRILLCPLWVAHVKCEDVYSDFPCNVQV